MRTKCDCKKWNQRTHQLETGYICMNDMTMGLCELNKYFCGFATVSHTRAAHSRHSLFCRRWKLSCLPNVRSCQDIRFSSPCVLECVMCSVVCSMLGANSVRSSTHSIRAVYIHAYVYINKYVYGVASCFLSINSVIFTLQAFAPYIIIIIVESFDMLKMQRNTLFLFCKLSTMTKWLLPMHNASV